MRRFLADSMLVFRRQAGEAKRDPGPFFVLPMLPALLMTIVFTALFDRMASVDGFSGDDYDAFLVPGVVTLVALLGGGATSASVAADLRSGYFDRLRLLPVDLRALLAGRLLFEAARLLPATTVVLIVAFAFGGRAENGVVGILVVVGLIALLGVAHTGLFYVVAIRTKDPQTPFTMQPLGLPLSFLSTALVPLAVMPGWAEAMARYNPVTVVVDGARQSMIGDLWSADLAGAVAVLVVWIVLGQLAAWTTLSTLVRRS